MMIEAGQEYLTNDGRRARCLGVTEDGRCAMVIEGRKMIETYGRDGTFRITSDRETDERLHIAAKYEPPITLWAIVSATGKICAVNRDDEALTENARALGRLVEFLEVRK
jgi:hypothetical protein